MNNFDIFDFSNHVDEIGIINISDQPFEQRYSPRFFRDIDSLLERITVPVTIGGGVSTVSEARKLFDYGADKILVASACLKRPDISHEISTMFGAQSLIFQLDIDFERGIVFADNGETPFNTVDNLPQMLRDVSAGEVCFNSIDRDGTGMGFPIHKTGFAADLPLRMIFSGGFGESRHFKDVLNHSSVDACSTSNILNFLGDGMADVRTDLVKAGILVSG
jgi:cyclase